MHISMSITTRIIARSMNYHSCDCMISFLTHITVSPLPAPTHQPPLFLLLLNVENCLCRLLSINHDPPKMRNTTCLSLQLEAIQIFIGLSELEQANE